MRYRIQINAVVEAPSAAHAAADAQKLQKLLDQPILKMVLQGVQLVEAKVDSKVTPA